MIPLDCRSARSLYHL